MEKMTKTYHPNLTAKDCKRIVALRKKGRKYREIADECGVHPGTVWRVLSGKHENSPLNNKDRR